MTNQVYFKVFFENGEESEIRKFMFSESLVVPAYSSFAKKVQSVFPGLQGRKFSIHWQDDVGDYINVSSDEELALALVEMSSMSSYKFYVKPVEEAKKTGTSDEAANNPIIAVGIGLPNLSTYCICDHCNIQIHEVRYKCLQCDDYDLCAKCEAQGIHPAHFMLRIPVDANWRHKVHNVLQKFMENTAYLSAAEKHAQRHGHKCGRNRRTCRRIAKAEEAMKYFGINFKDLMSNVETEAIFDIKSLVLDGLKEAFETYSTEFANEDESNEQPQEDKKSATDNRKDECAASQKEPSASQGSESDKAETVDEWMLIDDSEPASADDKTKSKTPEETQSNTEKKESTNVSKSESSHISETVSSVTHKDTEDKKGENPNESSTPCDKKIYPDLDDASRIFHTDPKIQAAIRSIMDMGFSNTGGLLTYLVIAENGNIDKILDILLSR